MMTHFKILTGLLFAFTFSTLAVENKPNILFLFADDMVYDAFGKVSNSYIKTPNIDKLAERGVHFTRAYNMGAWNGVVCAASRTQLNAGVTLWHAKALAGAKNKKNTVIPKVTPWSERLKNAGYHTYMTGKWHVKTMDTKAIFDQVGTERPGMPGSKGANQKHRPVEGKPDTWDAADESLEGFWKGGTHWSVVTANETIDYLDQRSKAKDNKPFFAYIAFNAPHDPRQSPQTYLDMYPVKDVPLPPAFMPSYPYSKQTGTYDIRAEHMAPRPRTEYAIKVHRREYYALITHLDEQIGRILDKLEQSGMAENTYIVFTADHGLSVGNHSFMAKQSMYDHSLAAPLIMVGPNLPKNKTSNQRLYIQDIVPTTLDWAKADKTGVEFTSININKGGQLTRNEQAIYGGYKELSRCIIQDSWKLMVYPTVPKLRLFDLKNDPHELNDLADNANYQNKIKQLAKVLTAEQQRLDDKLDLTALLP